jgi:hypothetical protein
MEAMLGDYSKYFGGTSMNEDFPSDVNSPKSWWVGSRIMHHIWQRRHLREEETTPTRDDEPALEMIDRRYRERAAQLLRLKSVLFELSTLPLEQRHTVQPLNPLTPLEVRAFVHERFRDMRVKEMKPEHGLTAISRHLINAYTPGVDIFEKVDFQSSKRDLFLFDPLSGFVIWRDGKRIRNFWLGNQRDILEVEHQSEPLRSALFREREDHFSLGATLFERHVEPKMRTRRYVRNDRCDIPTIVVNTQRDLEELVDDVREACGRLPFNVSVYFRGQSSEHLLPDRRDLADAGVCPYANILDHSIIPSLYRRYDQFIDTVPNFRSLLSHLLDWSLYSDLIFGDPGTYLSLDGVPYEPKSVPNDARVLMAMSFGGSSNQHRALDDLGPYTTWTISDSKGNTIDQYVKTYQLARDNIRRHLLLQHYGAPTPFVDVTRDPRIALWFALNHITVEKDGLAVSGRVEAPFDKAVIYVFLTLDGLAPVVKSEELIAPESALRPHRQACALLGGAGNLYRNAAARFIGLKIKLSRTFIPASLPEARHLFPGPDEDDALKQLLRQYDDPENLRYFPVYWFPGAESAPRE